MCMKVRVTEGVLQECCQRLSQSAEQVEQVEQPEQVEQVKQVEQVEQVKQPKQTNQPMMTAKEEEKMDRATLKECIQEDSQLNEELTNLLTAICNQKRVIPQVCLLYHLISYRTYNPSFMSNQSSCPPCSNNFVIILSLHSTSRCSWLSEENKKSLHSNKSFIHIHSFLSNRISPMVQEKPTFIRISIKLVSYSNRPSNTDNLPLTSRCE